MGVQDSLLLFRHDPRILPGLGPHQGGLKGLACRQGGAGGSSIDLLNTGDPALAAALAQDLHLGQGAPVKHPDGRFSLEATLKGTVGGAFLDFGLCGKKIRCLSLNFVLYFLAMGWIFFVES